MEHRDQLEGRNLVIEVLRRQKRRVRKVLLDERAKSNPKVKQLVSLVEESGVSLERVPRFRLDRMSITQVHNGVIAFADPHRVYTVYERLEEVYVRGDAPFFVLADELNYEQNLGAILRSSMGSGVHAVVVPTKRGKGLTPIVQRVAMGGAEEVPVIREGLSSALATLRRAGVRVVGADMDGPPCWDVKMTGALALVVGGEHKGLTKTLRKRCDAIAGIPLAHELDSFNVSVSTGILLYEKVRQESLIG